MAFGTRVLTLAGLVIVVGACTSAADIPDEEYGTPAPKRNRGALVDAGGGDDSSPEGSGATRSGAPAPPPATPPASSPGSGTPTDAGAAPDATPPAPVGPCAGATTKTACYQCCDAKHPAALQRLDNYYWDCMCAAGRCGSACAKSACAGYPAAAGSACDVCMTNNYAVCDQSSFESCDKDPNCAPLFVCDRSSGCAAKP